jgi:hypothetical protein
MWDSLWDYSPQKTKSKNISIAKMPVVFLGVELQPGEKKMKGNHV